MTNLTRLHYGLILSKLTISNCYYISVICMLYKPRGIITLKVNKKSDLRISDCKQTICRYLSILEISGLELDNDIQID